MDDKQLVVKRLEGKTVRQLLIDLEEDNCIINDQIGELIKPFVPEDVQNVSPGLIFDWYPISTFWNCQKSPIGCCMYSKNEDRAHDSCLFCGEPEERK